MSEQSLYHISKDLETIMNTDEEVDFSLIDSLAWKFEEKIGNCGRYTRLLADKEKMFAEREKAFGTEKMMMRKQRENIINYMLKCMNAVEASSITSGDITAEIKKNPPKVVYTDSFAAPAEFLIEQAPRVDAAGIKNALKAGQMVEGATLAQGFRLEVK